jgi:signal transduction histidine kinase
MSDPLPPDRTPEMCALLEAVLRQMPRAVTVAAVPTREILLENRGVAEIWNDPIPSIQPHLRPPREGYFPDGSPYQPRDWPIARTAASGGVVAGEEIEIVRRDGMRRTVLVSSSPVLGPDGELLAAVSTMYDITEQKQREAARLGESQAATRAKNDFLAVISHELRTPLTAIIGYTELLELGIPEPVSPGQREQLERVEISAHHLLHLIEEILTLVSYEGGKAVIHPAPVRLAELLHRAKVIVAPLAAEKQLDFFVEPLDEEIEMVADSETIVRLLVNLLSNAVKFTDEGRVRLRARRVGETVELEVSDTGVGLRPEHLEQVFEPFWQVEQPITRRAGGSGLGLAVSRRLARLHGGHIRVASEPGRGSTFTAILPMRTES